MQSFVYFVQDPETALIKIGFSVCVLARLTDLGRMLGREVALLAVSPGGFHEEHAYHEKHAALRESGEWFRPEESLLAEVRQLQRAHAVYLETPALLDVPADAEMMTPKDVASLLHMSVSSVRRYADSGHLPVYRTTGGHRRFRPVDVVALLERLADPGAPVVTFPEHSRSS